MDRLTGVYRRRVQVWLLLIGLIVTGLTGADTFRVVDGLHNSAALQQFVINEAGRITAPAAASPAASLTVRDTLPVAAQAGGPGIQSAELQPTPEPQAPPPTEPTAPPVAQVAATLSQVQGLFGYGDAPATWEWSKPVLLYVLRKIVGLLLTTAAISLGAPFWFQVLQRVANLRGAGPQPAANNK